MPWGYKKRYPGRYYVDSWVEDYEYRVVGDGTHHPTPQQLFDAIKGMEKRWFMTDGGLLSCQPPSSTVDNLPCGVYSVGYDAQESSQYAERLTIRSDELLDFYGDSHPLRRDLAHFMASKELYKELNLLHKRGALLYGPPGCGKTSFIFKVLQDLAEAGEDFISLYFDGGLTPSPDTLKRLDEDEKERLKILIFEEIVAVKNMERLLTILDGQYSIGGVYVYLTTNYPDRLPMSVVDRPGRVDMIEEFRAMPVDRVKLLCEKIAGRELHDSEVQKMKGLPVAHIKEICLKYKVQGETFEASIDRQKRHIELAKKHFQKSAEIGFGTSESGDNFE